MIKMIKLVGILSLLFVITACGNNRQYDYTAFKNSKPKSILILPPINKTVDIKAINSVYAQATLPLAESGYYVFPVTLVNETLKQNGITTSEDAHSINITKLHEIFDADSVLYLTINEYGTSYKVITTDTTVSVTALLVDGKTGKEIWKGSARATSGDNSSSNSILGTLIATAVNHVIKTAMDEDYQIAGKTDALLLNAGGNNSILYGPRSPKYEK